jgi:hypothetical protein
LRASGGMRSSIRWCCASTGRDSITSLRNAWGYLNSVSLVTRRLPFSQNTPFSGPFHGVLWCLSVFYAFDLQLATCLVFCFLLFFLLSAKFCFSLSSSVSYSFVATYLPCCRLSPFLLSALCNSSFLCPLPFFATLSSSALLLSRHGMLSNLYDLQSTLCPLLYPLPSVLLPDLVHPLISTLEPLHSFLLPLPLSEALNNYPPPPFTPRLDLTLIFEVVGCRASELRSRVRVESLHLATRTKRLQI